MEAEIIRSKRRTIEIQICPDAHVRVRAPYRMKNSEIEAFLREKAHWIEKHIALVKEKAAQEAAHPVEPLTDRDIKALADESIRVLPPKVARFAAQLGVTYGRITIRNQKTRWGSCSSKGNLNFNCLLMLTPPEVQDYVVIHELCHRLQMNHSAAFWKEVAKLMPDYEVPRRWLHENGEQIMRRQFSPQASPPA